MSSIHDLITSLKFAFRDSVFSRIENELLSREKKFNHEIEDQRKEINKQRNEIEEQQKEIDKQRNDIEKLRREFKELEEQLEFVRLDKIRAEQDLKDKCKDNEHCLELLDKMKSRVSVAEEELANFKSLKDSLVNGEKEVKTEAKVIDHKAIPRHKGNGKPLSEKIVEILDSDEDCAQSETNVKIIPEKSSKDNLHLDQTVSENGSGVLRRKRALAVCEGNGNQDSHDRNEVVDKSSIDRRKRTKELIDSFLNSPINHPTKTIKSPDKGSLQKELKYLTDDSDISDGSTCSDDSDDYLISDYKFKPIFISKAPGIIYQKKWNCEAELKAALEKDEALCMKAVCELSRQQNGSGKNVSVPSTSEHLGFEKLYEQRGMLLSKFLTAGDPAGKLKKSVADLNAYDPRGLADCRSIAIAHVKQLLKISQQNGDSLFSN